MKQFSGFLKEHEGLEWGMKLNSNSLNTKIHWVCNDCGNAALKMPENKGKKQFYISTWHTAECDVCHKHKPVTEARDFMFPVFEVNGG